MPYAVVVEDDPALADLMEHHLLTAGFTVMKCAGAEEAISLAHAHRPIIMLVDWQIEEGSGLEVCRIVRRTKALRNTGVIMISARSIDDDRIRGLEAGADDYLVKPFSPRELMSRVSAILRRRHPRWSGNVVKYEDLEVNAKDNKATYQGLDLHLSPIECRLLSVLAERPTRVFTRNEIIDEVWGMESLVDYLTVNVYIKRIRDALSHTNSRIKILTIRGSGYTLSD